MISALVRIDRGEDLVSQQDRPLLGAGPDHLQDLFHRASSEKEKIYPTVSIGIIALNYHDVNSKRFGGKTENHQHS